MKTFWVQLINSETKFLTILGAEVDTNLKASTHLAMSLISHKAHHVNKTACKAQLTPERHKYGKEHCARIVEQVCDFRMKTRLLQVPVVTEVITSWAHYDVQPFIADIFTMQERMHILQLIT